MHLCEANHYDMVMGKTLNPVLQAQLQQLLEHESSWAWKMRQKIAKTQTHCIDNLREALLAQPADQNVIDLAFHLGIWRAQQLRKEIVDHVLTLNEAHSVRAAQRLLKLPALKNEIFGTDLWHTCTVNHGLMFLNQKFMQLMFCTAVAREYLSSLILFCQKNSQTASIDNRFEKYGSACSLK